MSVPSRLNGDMIRKLYEEDQLEPKEIAEIMGCQWRAIYKRMEILGIQKRGIVAGIRKITVKKYSPYRERVAELSALKMSPTNIARQIGIRPLTVHHVMKAFNIPILSKRDYTKENNHNWKGGIKTTFHGYVRERAPDHPYVASDGYVPQHRLVMEKKIGRYLMPGEHVHHIDGDPRNNDIRNLELLSPGDHMQRGALCTKCPLRKEIRNLKSQLTKALKTCQMSLDGIL